MDRRSFLCAAGSIIPVYAIGQSRAIANASNPARAGGDQFMGQWLNPAHEFSQAPFWFWNDRLSDKEILRQIDDFVAHGVYGFTIHPRAGLPRDIGWMSDNMIKFMRTAIEAAAKRDMWVVLYDEGMYPSGSASGQVVAENPAFKTRALFCIDLDTSKPGSTQQGVKIGKDGEPELAEGQTLVAIVKAQSDGHRLAIVDRAMVKGRGVIRGLHFLEDDPPRRADHREVRENSPPGGDILNPKSVACFIRLVYQRYYDEFSSHFGKTIKAVFTDEPSMLARSAERGAVAGTTGILKHINRFLGYDFTPHLPALWKSDEPDAAKYRRDYNRALQARLEETFYAQLSKWCADHGVALTGHPAAPDDIGHLRYFQMPGQDIVWRYIEPGKKSAIEGSQSTVAKCASSAMIHQGRRRNCNEFCGAYGHDFTFDEMKWLTRWLIVRGCNTLYPHAFYYSIRGPRIDERPPQVGLHSPWWASYKPYADTCRRLCWLNADSKHVCHIAVLGRNDHLPWQCVKALFQNQRDFNYLEARRLWQDARTTAEGISIRGMQYKTLVVQDDPPAEAAEAIKTLEKAGRLLRWDKDTPDADFIASIDKLIEPDVTLTPANVDIRVRHVVKYGHHCYIVFNEGEKVADFELKTAAKGRLAELDCVEGETAKTQTGGSLHLEPHEMKVLMVS